MSPPERFGVSLADRPSADASSAPAVDPAVSSIDVLLTPPPAPPVRRYGHRVSQTYPSRAESSFGSEADYPLYSLIGSSWP